MITLHFFWGGCLICLIVLVVKLLTGFEAFCPPVKDLALGVSVVILDGASVLQIREQYTNDVFKSLRNIHFLCS